MGAQGNGRMWRWQHPVPGKRCRAAAQSGVVVSGVDRDGDECAVALVVEERAHHLGPVPVERARAPARSALKAAADAALREAKDEVAGGADLLDAAAAAIRMLLPSGQRVRLEEIEHQPEPQVGEALTRRAADERAADALVELPVE